MSNIQIPTITIAELKEHLKVFPDDCDISFSGLTFYRTKARGPKLVQIEFKETIYCEENNRVVARKSLRRALSSKILDSFGRK